MISWNCDNDVFEDDDFECISRDQYETNRNIRDFVRSRIEKFFEDKTMHCGGKVPNYMVASQKKISMVLSTNILDAVDLAYGSMREDNNASAFHMETSNDVKLVNDVLALIGRSGTPQQYAGGILLMYLKFVKGFNIDV